MTEIKYSPDPALNARMADLVEAINGGESPLEVYVKTALTDLRLPDAKDASPRFRFWDGSGKGGKLNTYTGVDKNNKLAEEVKYGRAQIKSDTVILRNTEPVRYSADHKLAGEIVFGYFKNNGKFVIKQKPDGLISKTLVSAGYRNQREALYNEWTSDLAFTDKSYGGGLTKQWQARPKLDPVHMLPVTQDMGKVAIYSESGIQMDVAPGGAIGFVAKVGKPVHAWNVIEQQWLGDTYKPLANYKPATGKQ